MEVQVRIKNVYGIDKTYPANAAAEQFAAIAGTKTLADSVLVAARALGFEIVRVF
jgi:hypothetical protein